MTQSADLTERDDDAGRTIALTGSLSLARLGDATVQGPDGLRARRRLLHVASHELLHAFTIRHCVGFECLMNGSNSLDELDRQTVRPCPACLAKLDAATGVATADRIKAVHAFAVAHGLDDEAAAWAADLRELGR